MKKLLCAGFLLLTGVAQAVPYTSQLDHFTVNFPGPITTKTHKGGRAYVWDDAKAKGGASCIVVVFTGKERLSRYGAFKILKNADPHGSLNAKEAMFGSPPSTPGLEIQGLDQNGVPLQGRIYAAKQATYVVLGDNFDLGVSERFVRSFRLIEDAPKTPSQKAVKKR